MPATLSQPVAGHLLPSQPVPARHVPPSQPAPARHLPLDGLRRRVTGTVAEPGDPEYAALVTPWNLAVEVAPAVAVAALDAQDVVETVRFAAAHGLTVTPQATGHGPIAPLVGEILLSTRGLDECVVHPEGWARVGAGVKWLRVVEAAAPHGLAPLSGSITDVGVVGYTTGGGLGPMARTYGLASDRVRAFEVVTGDGVLRRVTATEHPELFFALRGGKGALGIVTAVELDLVHQPTFYGGSLWFDGADAAGVIEHWRSWSLGLPETVTTSFALFRLPAMPGVPPQLADRLTLSIRYVHTGDAAEAAELFAAMRAAAPVLLDDVSVKPYAAIDSVHTDPLDPLPAIESSLLLSELPAEAVGALVAAAGTGSGTELVLVEVRQLGGATGREGAHPSAFCQRDAAYSVLSVGVPGPSVERDVARVTGALDAWTLPATLPNFTVSADRLPGCYDAATLSRLRRAMETYDPHGVIAWSHALRG